LLGTCSSYIIKKHTQVGGDEYCQPGLGQRSFSLAMATVVAQFGQPECFSKSQLELAEDFPY
jgi:hypothetical protein